MNVDIEVLVHVQRRARELLVELGVLSLEKRRLRGTLLLCTTPLKEAVSRWGLVSSPSFVSSLGSVGRSQLTGRQSM